MYFKAFLLITLSTTVLAVYEDERYYRTPPPPRILSHKQTQLHDGGFKFAFAAENGLAQTEAIAPDGTRNGGYTYVDPHGKTITVKYTAGKDGFRIVEGDHIPKEVHAQTAPQHQQNSNSPPDDGSYKPEKYEDPYNEPEPSKPRFLPQPVYQQPPQPVYQHPPLPKPAPQYIVKNGADLPLHGYGFQKPYTKYQPPQPLVKYNVQAQPRSYDVGHQETLSNSLEAEGRQPVFYDEPGKPYSFGVGYAFHFQN